MHCFFMSPTANWYTRTCSRLLLQVIQEGQPCHLYFDLEYNTACNPGLDGDGLMDGLLAIVATGLRSAQSIQFPTSPTICFQSLHQATAPIDVGQSESLIASSYARYATIIIVNLHGHAACMALSMFCYATLAKTPAGSF